MKYCPHCRKMYNDEISTCTECKKGVEILEDENTPVFLISANGFEKNRIEAALNDAGIPCDEKRQKKSNSAQAVTGYDMDSINIVVPYQAYEKAYNVCVGIGAIKEDDEEILEDDGVTIKDDESSVDKLEKMGSAKRTTIRVVLALFFLALMCLAVFGTDAITGMIKNLISGNIGFFNFLS